MMKKNLLLALALVAGTSLYAQKGIEDGSKYGHGEDSIRCRQNLSLCYTYITQNDYATALEFWEIAYNECPASSVNLYNYGTRIRTWQLKNEKDPAKKMEYFNLLMQVYDQRIRYFGDYARMPAPSVLGRKAADYLVLHPDGENSDKQPAYEWLKTCVEQSSVSQFDPAYARYFIIASRSLLDKVPGHKTQFLSDYLAISDMLNRKLAEETDPAAQTKIKGYKQDVDDLLVNSGVADCASMEEIFAPDLEANKADAAWLDKVITLFKRAKCTETNVYFQASQYAHEVQPTAESAEGCAYMCIKKGDYMKAADYLKEAVSLETDNEKKAEYEYVAASALFAGKSYTEARRHALEAVNYKSDYADPYILIAKMYANSVDMFDDAVIRRAVYWVAVDKLEKAKSVDPSVAETVNELIRKYREQYPRSEDVFMHPEVDEGKPYTVKGWINERTIVRSKN